MYGDDEGEDGDHQGEDGDHIGFSTGTRMTIIISPTRREMTIKLK